MGIDFNTLVMGNSLFSSSNVELNLVLLLQVDLIVIKSILDLVEENAALDELVVRDLA